MTPLKGKEKLHVLEVPEDAEKFKISSLNYLCEYNAFGTKQVLYEYPLEGKFIILGTVTATEVSFDCEPYVEKHFYYPSYFKDYKAENPTSEDYYKYAIGSFRSLIEKETGKSFVNPYGEYEPYKNKIIDYSDYKEWLEKWQQAENNTLKKVIVIKEL